MRGTGHYAACGSRKLSAGLLAAVVLALSLAACGDDGATGGTSEPPTGPSKEAAGSYRLAAGGQELVASSGRRIPVDPKLAIGYVDAAQQTGSYLDMSGWGAPADLSRPADAVVAMVGGKSVVTAKPRRSRPDLVEGYNRQGLEQAGFAFSVPKSALRCSAPDGGLRTFVVAGDAAAPMKWLADVGQQVESAC